MKRILKFISALGFFCPFTYLGATSDENLWAYFGSGVSGSCGAEVERHMKKGREEFLSFSKKLKAFLRRKSNGFD